MARHPFFLFGGFVLLEFYLVGELTHMRSMCVNPSFKHLLSPRGDRCEQSASTVQQLLSHNYMFETLKRRLGFTAVPCWAMANLAGIDRFAQANAVGVAETGVVPTPTI